MPDSKTRFHHALNHLIAQRLKVSEKVGKAMGRPEIGVLDRLNLQRIAPRTVLPLDRVDKTASPVTQTSHRIAAIVTKYVGKPVPPPAPGVAPAKFAPLGVQEAADPTLGTKPADGMTEPKDHFTSLGGPYAHAYKEREGVRHLAKKIGVYGDVGTQKDVRAVHGLYQRVQGIRTAGSPVHGVPKTHAVKREVSDFMTRWHASRAGKNPQKIAAGKKAYNTKATNHAKAINAGPVLRTTPLDEAKKKIAGNLCVHTGSGSGGGFTGCGDTGSGTPVLPGVGRDLPASRVLVDKDSPLLRRGTGENAKGDLCKQFPAVCKGNRGLARADMPNIPGDRFDEFVGYLTAKGVKLALEKAEVGSLKATQKEINAEKVTSMALNLRKHPESARPIIVSKDGFILDGHHRWAALRLLSPRNTVKIRRASVGMTKLLRITQNFPGVLRRSFAESFLQEAKKKLIGNLCVNTGQGSGGGFIPCGGAAKQSGGNISGLLKSTLVAKSKSVLIAHRANEMLKEATSKFERDHILALAKAEVEANIAVANGTSKDKHSVGGVYTPERRVLHKEILKKIVGNNIPSQEHPVAVMLGGLPGSGKSSALARGMNMANKVVINADDIKAMLPGFTPDKAAAYHDESGDLADMAFALAKARRKSIVLDSTMKSLGSPGRGGVLGKVDDLRSAGYRVEARFSDVSVNTSAERAAKRFFETGRYVPMGYIRALTGKEGKSKNRNTFDEAKYRFDAFLLVDNNGASPVTLDKQGQLTD